MRNYGIADYPRMAIFSSLKSTITTEEAPTSGVEATLATFAKSSKHCKYGMSVSNPV
jgi:hypothetical protein